jgi:hypothetical protein
MGPTNGEEKMKRLLILMATGLALAAASSAQTGTSLNQELFFQL